MNETKRMPTMESTGEARPPAVVVPAFGRPESTRRALGSLLAEGAAQIVLVDDEGSGHGAELQREFPQVEVLATERAEFWTGSICRGTRWALQRGAEAVLFFNQDVVVEPGYFRRLSETAARHPGAVIGSAVVYAQERGTVWSAGAQSEWFGRGFRILHHGEPVSALPDEPFPVDWCHGMGTYVPAEVLRRIGLPDAERFPMAWGDADFTLRAREAGIPVLVDPLLRLVHEVGSYDARSAGPPRLGAYLSCLLDRRHNLSLRSQMEIWRRHGPRGLWPLSFALRVSFLLLNWVRIRLLFGARKLAA